MAQHQHQHQHSLRQLKFAIPGGGFTYYLGTIQEILRITLQGHGWGRIVAVASLALGLTNIALFMYMLMVPLIHGHELNYRGWRESRFLSTTIPTLTTCIVLGWSLLVLTFGLSSFGYFKGVLAAGSLYALTFGLMGLIPAPRARRV